MRLPTLAALLALTLMQGAATAAPDDELGRARGELSAILAKFVEEPRVPRGDSLTKLVRDFVAHPAPMVTALLNSAWQSRSRGPRHRMSLSPEEDLIRFLFLLPARRDPGLLEYGDRSGLRLEGGAVVLGRAVGGGGSGPGLQELAVRFDYLTGLASLRSIPPPSAATLLAVEIPIPSGHPLSRRWSDSTIVDFGMALGEECAADDEGFAALLARAITKPDDRVLLLALGWSRRPDAVEFLSHAVLDLASRAERAESWLDATIAAQRSLEHADPATLARVFASMTLEQRSRALGTPSRQELMKLRLDALDAATDVRSRREAELALCATCVSLERMPPGQDAVRLVRRLLAAIEGEDAALSKAAIDATEMLFATSIGTVFESSDEAAGGTWRSKGTRAGVIAGPGTVLRNCLADLESGALRFRERSPELNQVAEFVSQWGARALSDLPLPPRLPSARPSVPVRVRGAWTKDGLHVSLTNEGKRDVSVDPLVFRYGWAAHVDETNAPAGEVATSSKRFLLEFGSLWPSPVVSRSQLVVLKPGAAYECDVPVRAEFRSEPHADIAISRLFVERSDAPPVVAFEATPLF